MSEAIWNDIDDWLVATLDAEMGQSGLYATLQCNTVTATILRDLADVPRWTLPALIVDGEVIKREQITNNTCNNRYRKTHPYTIMAIVEGEREQVTIDAKVLEKRLERALRPVDVAITDSVDEVAYRLTLGDSQISISPKPMSHIATWYGIASFELTVISETRVI